MARTNKGSLSIVVLAAGKGKRMKSSLPKVLHTILEKPLLTYVLDAAFLMDPERVVVVVGHMAEKVEKVFAVCPAEFVRQEEQLGTAHAVSQSESLLGKSKGDILILSGDVPMIRKETLERLFQFHLETKKTVSFLSAEIPDPTGYGRVVRDSSGQVSAVIEEKDASPEVKIISEINTGIYCVKAPFLFGALKRITNDNEQQEYYLTDIVKYAFKTGESLGAVKAEFPDQLRGVNTREELLEMEKLFASNG
ncbi:MAG: sugar phosphate nucleotidyltransferase [Nitrospinota bacterium]